MGKERHQFREMGDAILSGIALFPIHFGIMLSIIVMVVSINVMTFL
jgi:hypothetical protein